MSLFGRRERREIAELNEYVNRLRAQRDKALKAQKTAESNQLNMARNQGVLLDEHRRVVARNQALCTRLEAVKSAGFDEARTRRAANRIQRLVKAVAKARTEAASEARRADRLQAQYDEAVDLTPSGIRDSGPWQPGYKQPQPDKEVSA